MCVGTFQTFLVLIMKVLWLIVNAEGNLPCFQPQCQFPFAQLPGRISQRPQIPYRATCTFGCHGACAKVPSCNLTD